MFVSIKKYFYFLLFAILFFITNLAFADTTSCYIPIEGKSGCDGLTSISDVTHTAQLKCFKIDKKAKDCGVFVNVLPFDTDQGLSTGLETLDCKGTDRNTQECVDYCYGNTNTSECVDCDSLTTTEKADYAYCSSTSCPAVSDDGNGSSWPETLAGVENVVGTCLEGYTGTAIRDCLTDASWDSLTTLCDATPCNIDDLNDDSYIDDLDDLTTLQKTAVKTATFNTTGTVENGSTTTSIGCESGYESTGTLEMECSKGKWIWVSSNSIPVCGICNIYNTAGSENTVTIISGEAVEIIACGGIGGNGYYNGAVVSNASAKGGCVEGKIELTENTTFYIYPGGSGASSSGLGGSGGSSHSNAACGGGSGVQVAGGGGACSMVRKGSSSGTILAVGGGSGGAAHTITGGYGGGGNGYHVAGNGGNPSGPTNCDFGSSTYPYAGSCATNSNFSGCNYKGTCGSGGGGGYYGGCGGGGFVSGVVGCGSGGGGGNYINSSEMTNTSSTPNSNGATGYVKICTVD